MSQYLVESTGRWLELTVSKLDDNHLIHVFTDVTSIKETQLQLERNVEDLKRLNQNLEEFAYAASHDLKEPTRKIHVFTERLKDSLGERLSEMEKKYFERMQLASKRMSTLIDDLLLYSEVSQKTALAETVDMNQVMDQVLSDLDLQVEQKGATIKVDQLFTFTGHRRQLQQAFYNLIGNALKYSRPDVTPVITIKCAIIKGSETGLQLLAEEQAKNYYQITVKDNGIGFEQADAERIFNVFTRLHGMAEYKGTGVGLSIVRKVVENHNGYIWAESQPDQGATFYILLPVS
jgi:signal transduction histidine kinase